MTDGLFGWRCACGLDTVCSRSFLNQSSGAACDACRVVMELGDGKCLDCGGALRRLDSIGSYREGGDRERAIAYWRERVFEEEFKSAWMKRHEPSPPSLRSPSFEAQALHDRAYSAWMDRCDARWRRERSLALEDAALVAEVIERCGPIVLERVALTMKGDRKYRCPACEKFELTWFAMPFPR